MPKLGPIVCQQLANNLEESGIGELLANCWENISRRLGNRLPEVLD